MINNIWRYVFDIRPVKADGRVDISLLAKLSPIIDIEKRKGVDGTIPRRLEILSDPNLEKSEVKVVKRIEIPINNRGAILQELENYINYTPPKFNNFSKNEQDSVVKAKLAYLAENDYFALTGRKLNKNYFSTNLFKRPKLRLLPDPDLRKPEVGVERRDAGGLIKVKKKSSDIIKQNQFHDQAIETKKKNIVPAVNGIVESNESDFLKEANPVVEPINNFNYTAICSEETQDSNQSHASSLKRLGILVMMIMAGVGALAFIFLLNKFYQNNDIEIKTGTASVIESSNKIQSQISGDVTIPDLKIWSSFVGYNEPRTYLIVFQDESQIRPTGGFIDTYGIVKLDKGEIKQFFVEDILEADSRLQINVVPPKPIQKVATAWSMHDANWFPQFEVSAEKLSWLYQKTGGENLDGVIAVNQNAVKEILKLLGPITLDDLEMNSDNFSALIQKANEEKNNQPKGIKIDFLTVLFNKLFRLREVDVQALAESFKDLLDKRELQVYLVRENEELIIKDLNWAGDILRKKESNYLSIYWAKINASRDNSLLTEDIIHQAEIIQDGSIINTLEIKGQGGEGDNYLQIYLPLETEIISAKGINQRQIKPPIDYQASSFMIDKNVEESEKFLNMPGKAIFGGWPTKTKDGSWHVVYKYRTSLADSSKYSFYFQKQSGINNLLFHSKVVKAAEIIFEKKIDGLTKDFYYDLDVE